MTLRQIVVGETFGHLTVIHPDAKSTGAVPHSRFGRWVMTQCKCGTIKPRAFAHLTIPTKVPRSCGCAARKAVGDRNRTHGKSDLPEFTIWSGMIDRCTNPNSHAFDKYSKRGICDRWNKKAGGSFEAFLADMKLRPSPEHTIERIDNDGPYAPWNCRWATRPEQVRNRSNTVYITHKGVRKPLVEACEEESFPYATALDRLKSGRISEAHLFVKKLPRWGTKVEYRGRKMTLAEAALLSGITYDTLHHRYKLGDRGDRLFRALERQRKAS